MRTARLVLVLTAGLACAGCFQLSSVLIVNADGSGTIQQRMLFTSAAIAQMRGLAALSGGGQNFDPLSETAVRAAAAALGAGVSYVSSTPVTTGDGQGRDIVYAFTDINTLRLSEEPPIPGGGGLRPQGSSTEVSFKLEPQPGGTSLLRIVVPRPALPGATPGSPAQISPDQLAMFKQMFAGARLSIVVEPEGQVVRTSSPYVDGRRVTLIDIDIDQLFKDDSLLAKLQTVKTPEEAKALLEGVSGVKVNLDPEITIEFGPAR